MSRTYNIVDADGHILEPLDLWTRYIDPEFRDSAPQLMVEPDGREWLAIKGQKLGGPLVRHTALKKSYSNGRPGGFDPHARIKDLDLDGIDAVFLYPTVALRAGAVEDPRLAAAMCRAYNRWIVEYCKPYPDRLFGVAMLPMQSVELAIEELRFARHQLGLRSGFVRPNPYNDRLLCDPAYEPLWAEAQELDFAIGFHEGTGGMKAVAVDRVRGFAAQHIVSHTMEMQLACLNVIWGGVCERFPKLRFAFLESGGGWMPGWLDRMDRHFNQKGVFADEALKMPPSDYFRRQCWISFEPVEGTIAHAAEYLGADKILWATDYPHIDGFFPGAPKMIQDKLPPALRQGVLAQGALAFYGMH